MSAHATGTGEHPAMSKTTLLAPHFERTEANLRQQTVEALDALGGKTSTAVLFFAMDGGSRIVELSQGTCPFAVGDRVESGEWITPTILFRPLYYGEHQVGELLIDNAVEPGDLENIQDIGSHFASALVNLKLNDEALKTSDEYYAGLQALEEGVILFQERDKEAVSARFLSLLTSLVGTAPGAIYLLEQTGDPDSTLLLESALGVPEALLEELVREDGTWWPGTTLGQPPQVLLRDEQGSMPELDDQRVPAALTSVVTCPLKYHGLTVGVGLALNAPEQQVTKSKLESIRRLGELGAAIFHRIRLEEVAVRSQEVETQLAIASRIQARLLPTEAPKSTSIECAWSSKPAQMVGGDFLDLISAEDGSVNAVIADVSGHGINSALLMTSFRATYRAECERHDPGEVLEILNREICNEAGDTGMFVTAASFRLSPDGRTASYASAGHNDVYLYRAATGAVECLESTGPSTGFFPGSDYEVVELDLQPHDILLLYTDGLVEAKQAGAEFEMYGDDRLQDLLVQNSTRPVDEILATILDDLATYAGTEMHDDDVSVSVIRVV